MEGTSGSGHCARDDLLVGKTYDEIDRRLRTFIESQPVFFVSTAPLGADGHINLSPKGNQSDLRVVGPRRVQYRDLTGSGAETIAHLRENGRITLMFCAFDGPPRIVRLHGHGRALTGGDEFDEQSNEFPPHAGTRSIIDIAVERISDSCGYNVPLMPFTEHRRNLDHWTAQKSADDLAEYRREKNASSIDGLPAL